MAEERGKSTTRALREQRLGFRLDEGSKKLIEQAARLERRKLTEFCVAVLTDAARQTIEKHGTLTLSENDRSVFFDILVNPPAPSERLRRAFVSEQRRVTECQPNSASSL